MPTIRGHVVQRTEGVTSLTVGPEIYKQMKVQPQAGDLLVAHVRKPGEWAAPVGWTQDGAYAMRRLEAVEPVAYTFTGMTAGGFDIDFLLIRDEWPAAWNPGMTTIDPP